MGQILTKYTCEGCNRVFDSLHLIRNHIITCIRPVRGSAFQDILIRDISTGERNSSRKESDENVDKVLPPSQPLLTASQMQSHSQDLFIQSQGDEQQEEEEYDSTPATLTEQLNIQKKPAKCQ